MKKIIGYICLRNGKYRMSLIEYPLKERKYLNRENKKEIFWENKESLYDLLDQIPSELKSSEINIHNGLRFSMKKGIPLTDGCEAISSDEHYRVRQVVNNRRIAA